MNNRIIKAYIEMKKSQTVEKPKSNKTQVKSALVRTGCKQDNQKSL